MEGEGERTGTSVGDGGARDGDTRDRTRAARVEKEGMRAEKDRGEPGIASGQSWEGVEELERNPEGATSVQSFLPRRDDGSGGAVHAFPSLSCSSSSSSWCPSPSAFLSALSLSSSSPQPSLAPFLPPSLKMDGVLVDGRLALDVYRRGGAAMPALWESAPERMKRVRYVRLGSEDQEALEDSLSVLPHLTQLRSLAIRGTHTHTVTHNLTLKYNFMY